MVVGLFAMGRDLAASPVYDAAYGAELFALSP